MQEEEGAAVDRVQEQMPGEEVGTLGEGWAADQVWLHCTTEASCSGPCLRQTERGQMKLFRSKYKHPHEERKYFRSTQGVIYTSNCSCNCQGVFYKSRPKAVEDHGHLFMNWFVF